MRISCPTCDAHYEVPEGAIPAAGRDVQCSSCGHTWLQMPPVADTAAEAPSAGPAAPPEVPPEATGSGTASRADGSATPETPGPAETAPGEAKAPRARPLAEGAAAAPQTQPAPGPVSGTGAPVPDPDESDPAPEEQPAATAARPRRLSEDVTSVLREEAAWEARHRAAEGGRIETQPELGLDDGHEPPKTPRRVIRERLPDREPDTAETPEPAEAPGTAPSRRDLLPDIDEINQSLRATDSPRRMETVQGRAAMAEEDEEERAGFGRGFVTVLAFGAALLALYLAAPAIAAAVPPLAPPLDAYVTGVDAARQWLDSQLIGLLRALDSMSSEAGGG